MTAEPPDLAAAAWRGREVVVLSPTPTHPQDHGNRKRVHAVCARLKAEGARIHFVHYASEVEWRDRYPLDAQRAMVEAWDSYTLVAPTRPLHPAPRGGPDHRTDEWWDWAIEGTLRWLFARVDADMLLVNYTWLSKALDLAPARALRVLDTHDRFSGRRELLEAHGIAREFFHLDEAGEAKALARAHLVWAIKEQEEAFFRTLVDRPVVTVPHVDAWRPLARPPPDPAAGLRLGVIGALNNLNLKNIQAFLDTALPIFRAHLAPLRVRIAGSVCKGLGHLAPDPFVELVGPLDDVETFYRSLDAALVPMAFSTGLKIKAAEAMGFGLPVLAHAHAFEGYRVHHPAQAVPYFAALARACVALAYDPSGLVALRDASAATRRTTEAAFAAGLAATADELAHHRPPVLLLPGTAGALAEAWLASMEPFYRAVGEVRTVRPAPNDPLALQALVDAAEVVVVGDLPEGLAAAVDWSGADVHLVAGLAGFDRAPGALERLAAALRASRDLVLLAADRVTPAQAGAARHARVAVPSTLFGDNPPGSLRPPPPDRGPPDLLVLATAQATARARALLAAVRRDVAWCDARLACPWPAPEGGELDLRAAAAWLLGPDRPRGLVAVDLEPDALAHAALREILLRQGRLVVDGPTTPALLARLIRVGPRPTKPAYRRGSLDWLWRHLARRKRERFGARPGADRNLTLPSATRSL